jgi:hypothetical protein
MTAHYEEAAWALLADLQDVRGERDAYRFLAQQALHALAEMTRARTRDQQRYVVLLEELRALRGTERRAA